jgi:glycosyltransferase involved in cell wall biosynthesis
MSVAAPDLEYLASALGSLLEQNYVNFEIILLEDPSPRSAESLVRQLADPRIIYRRNERAMSLAESRNRCIELARAELLAIMDADDICHPRRLEKQLEFMQANESVSVLGTQIAIIDADGQTKGFRRYPLEHAAILQAMRRFNPLAHPSIMMRKSAVLAAGGYRYEGDNICDDYDLWSRMAGTPSRFANCPEPLLQYRIHEGSTKSRKLHQTLRDSIRIKQKYFGQVMSPRERLRILGERALLCMPARLVSQLFALTNIRRRLPSGPGAERSLA